MIQIQPSDLCLDRMARWLTTVVLSSHEASGWLRHYEEEVYSEALVAVSTANKAYPGQVCCQTWTPGVVKYARGCLISGLRRDKLIPYNGKDFPVPWTNWDFNNEDGER